MQILRQLDPQGVELRRRHRLQRRVYTSKVNVLVGMCSMVMQLYIVMQGSNFCWHIDGYDKLSLYGFHIHGCIDG